MREELAVEPGVNRRMPRRNRLRVLERDSFVRPIRRQRGLQLLPAGRASYVLQDVGHGVNVERADRAMHFVAVGPGPTVQLIFWNT